MKSHSELIFWLALNNILYASPLIAKKLLEIYNSPKNVFHALSGMPMTEGALHSVKIFKDWDLCENDLKRCEREGISIITFNDSQYPKLLKEIADPPLLLMVKGDPEILSGPCISIVGARKATPHGKDIAFEIARDLAGHGIVVVSGMAYGIDAAAHAGAIETGRTIAVWGSGIDRCYPLPFKDLSEKIVRCGCVVSEFPLGTPPNAWNFPQRNRIISGLSLGVIVVEAAAKSGSLITSGFALEQGREVFAVPGPACGTMSQGTHMLLRSGATFVERAEDVIAAVAPQMSFPSKNSRHLTHVDSNDRPMLNCISGEGSSLDVIIRQSGLPSSDVLRELTLLTLEGAVEELPGKQYRRKK